MTLRRTFRPVAVLQIDEVSNEPSRSFRRLKRRRAKPNDVTTKSGRGDVYVKRPGGGVSLIRKNSSDRYDGRFK